MGLRIAIAAAVAAAIIFGGCSGGSSSDASADGASQTIEASNPGEVEASKPFQKPGSNKEIVEFGQEASVEEREAASRVLEENLIARASGDWAAQCASLTPAAVKEVEQGAAAQGVKKGSCATELKGRAEPLQRSKPLRVNTMTGPIDALRFKGSRAYALYHGTGGQDYAMPMEKIDGEWKVDSLLTAAP